MLCYRLLFIPLLSISLNCYPQIKDTIPVLDKSDLPGAKFQPARTYTGSALYGYIDGGAQLYLEYGFSSTRICEIEYMKGKYKTEVFMMQGPEEAFGIFSASRYKCRSIPPVAPFACSNKYQLQICDGRFYISIINGTGNSTDSVASLRIGEAFVRKINGPSADLSSFLPGVPSETIREHAVLAKGKLGLMNGAPDWEDYFRDVSDYVLVVLQVKNKTMLSVRFRTEDDLDKFVLAHKVKDANLPEVPEKIPGNETIKRLSGNQLLITIEE